MTQPYDDYQPAITLGPDLELRVRRPDGTVDARRVRGGLTIGRAAASDLTVDDPAANLIHARVAPGAGGRWDLICVGRSVLALDEDYNARRVTLTPGSAFYVGKTRVDCAAVPVELLAEIVYEEDAAAPDDTAGGDAPAADADAPARDAAAAATGVPMPKLVICPTCYKDMTGVSVAARFCPKCGAHLPARNAQGYLIPPEESSPLYPVYRALRDELQEKLADQSPRVASSMVILAYANAMLKLGWKYEHGRGLLRNLDEAARCYEKAGSLSQLWDQK